MLAKSGKEARCTTCTITPPAREGGPTGGTAQFWGTEGPVDAGKAVDHYASIDGIRDHKAQANYVDTAWDNSGGTTFINEPNFASSSMFDAIWNDEVKGEVLW